jgi:hypothetical protein
VVAAEALDLDRGFRRRWYSPAPEERRTNKRVFRVF